MIQNKKDRKKEKGFTLIEIVAVLVILGILAAVAVPRYFDLQAQSQQSAVDALSGEVQARVNLLFAQRLMGTPASGSGDTAVAAVAPMTCENARNIALADLGAFSGGWTIGGTVTALSVTNTDLGITTALTPRVQPELPTCN